MTSTGSFGQGLHHLLSYCMHTHHPQCCNCDESTLRNVRYSQSHYVRNIKNGGIESQVPVTTNNRAGERKISRIMAVKLT